MTTKFNESHNPHLPKPEDYSQQIERQPDPEKMDGGTRLVATLFLGLCILAVALLYLAFR